MIEEFFTNTDIYFAILLVLAGYGLMLTGLLFELQKERHRRNEEKQLKEKIQLEVLKEKDK